MKFADSPEQKVYDSLLLPIEIFGEIFRQKNYQSPESVICERQMVSRKYWLAIEGFPVMVFVRLCDFLAILFV